MVCVGVAFVRAPFRDLRSKISDLRISGQTAPVWDPRLQIRESYFLRAPARKPMGFASVRGAVISCRMASKTILN